MVRVIMYTDTHQISLKSHKPFVDGYLLQTSKSRNTKTREKNQKSGPDKLYVLPSNLRIRGHLPASL